jgi:hypothetical protein
MRTVNENYKKNTAILKINLERGMNEKQSNEVINGFENQFITAGLYGKEEKRFINEMRKLVIERFSGIEVNIIK